MDSIFLLIMLACNLLLPPILCILIYQLLSRKVLTRKLSVSIAFLMFGFVMLSFPWAMMFATADILALFYKLFPSLLTASWDVGVPMAIVFIFYLGCFTSIVSFVVACLVACVNTFSGK
jgi:hypothetical protein